VIVFVHGADEQGAVERYVEAVVAGLREGDEPVVLLHADVPALESFAALAGDAVRVESYPLAWLQGPAPRTFVQLLRRLLWLRPRVVHVADVWPVAQAAARLTGARVLVTHHTPELQREFSFAGRAWWRLGWAVRPEVIYTSETDRVRDGRRLLRTHVVPLGIELDRFLTVDRPVGRAVVGNVARLVPQKGHLILLDAASLVLERRPDARFVIAGDGELRETLEDTALRLGIAEHVELCGHVDDVPSLLATFDVFAFPSLFEGLCLAVIEAQAAGVPVVATPVGGIRETVVDGVTGMLVPVGDPRALANAIVRLLDRPEEAARLAGEARRRATRYSLEAMVAGTLSLYA
jgi:glycosyltransferase involved in cell wall biosynthesis